MPLGHGHGGAGGCGVVGAGELLRCVAQPARCLQECEFRVLLPMAIVPVWWCVVGFTMGTPANLRAKIGRPSPGVSGLPFGAWQSTTRNALRALRPPGSFQTLEQ